MKQIILASTSPRRKQLLEQLGLSFKVAAGNYHEVHHPHFTPEQTVKFLALGKAQAVAKQHRRAIIIGADTIVVWRGKIFHKPKTGAEAYKTLSQLSGRAHDVYTGVAAVDAGSGKKIVRAVKTKIY